MSIDVADQILIERPIEEVAAYAGDPGNAPEWRRWVTSVEWRTEPPIALGSQVLAHARFLGRQVDALCEVVELTPGEQVAVRTVALRSPMSTTSRWRPVGPAKTHMVLRQHSEPSGVARLASPLIRRAMRRMVRRDLDTLKRLLERRG